MREREIEKKLVMEMRKHGGLALKFVSSDYYAVMQSVRQDLHGNGTGVSNRCVRDRLKEMPQEFTNNRGIVPRLGTPNEAIFARSNGTERPIYIVLCSTTLYGEEFVTLLPPYEVWLTSRCSKGGFRNEFLS